MTPETRIPVYRREVAPGIGFTTFSAEGTTLIGWITSCRAPSVKCDTLQFPGPNGRYIDEYFPEVALAYAHAGQMGLKFEEITGKQEPREIIVETNQELRDVHGRTIRFVEGKEVKSRYHVSTLNMAFHSPAIRVVDATDGNSPFATFVENDVSAKPKPFVKDALDAEFEAYVKDHREKEFRKAIVENFGYVMDALPKSGPDAVGGYFVPKEIAEPFIAAIVAGQKVLYSNGPALPEGYFNALVKPDHAGSPPAEPKPESWRDRKPLL